jgi:hypothetical protein
VGPGKDRPTGEASWSPRLRFVYRASPAGISLIEATVMQGQQKNQADHQGAGAAKDLARQRRAGVERQGNIMFWVTLAAALSIMVIAMIYAIIF